MNMKDEKDALNNIAKTSIYAKGIAVKEIIYSTKIFQRYMNAGGVLELGPAEGIGTEFLKEGHQDYTVVEGAEEFAQMLKKKFPDINVVNALFEEFNPDRKYENIILGHVLEHVEEPVNILKLCSEWLSDDGKIFCVVPNSHSLHRQAAVKMGLIKTESQFSAKDVRHGHRRVYDLDSLCKDFSDARLSIIKRGGYYLKPLTDKQIEETWDDDLIDAYMKLGEQYPEIAGDIYVIAQK